MRVRKPRLRMQARQTFAGVEIFDKQIGAFGECTLQRGECGVRVAEDGVYHGDVVRGDVWVFRHRVELRENFGKLVGLGIRSVARIGFGVLEDDVAAWIRYRHRIQLCADRTVHLGVVAQLRGDVARHCRRPLRERGRGEKSGDDECHGGQCFADDCGFQEVHDRFLARRRACQRIPYESAFAKPS